MLLIVFISIFILLLILTILKLYVLSNELSFLAPVNSIPFSNHHLLSRNIEDFIEINTNFKRNTTFLIMSPTCEVCHEKLKMIVKNKGDKNGTILFYADAHNKNQFDEMVSKFKEIKINPLNIVQIQNLNKGMFPMYIDVTPEGVITKVYLK